jgi:hypothetical protein
VGGSGDRADIREFSDVSGILTLSGRLRLSRAALLAGASFVALDTLGASALASCSDSNQTISTPTTSTGQSNGDNITITSGGSYHRETRYYSLFVAHGLLCGDDQQRRLDQLLDIWRL